MGFMNGEFDSLRRFLASPTFTGTPAGPTAAPGTNTTQLATTAFVLANGGVADDSVTIAKLAHGTAGNLITYDATGAPATVATGTATHVLTSQGAGAPPVFSAPAAGYTVAEQTAEIPATGDYLGGRDTSGNVERKFLAENVAALALGQGGYRSAATAFYYPVGLTTNGSATSVMTTKRVYYLPFFVGAPTTFIRIGCRVTTAEAASTVRLGIYNWAGGLPTGRVLDAGTVDSSGTGDKEITISQALQPGFYALALVAVGVPTLRAAAVAQAVLTQILGANDTNSNASTQAVYEDTAAGALPANAGAITNLQAAPPVAFVRV